MENTFKIFWIHCFIHNSFLTVIIKAHWIPLDLFKKWRGADGEYRGADGEYGEKWYCGV